MKFKDSWNIRFKNTWEIDNNTYTGKPMYYTTYNGERYRAWNTNPIIIFPQSVKEIPAVFISPFIWLIGRVKRMKTI